MSIRRPGAPTLQLPSGENITIDGSVTIGRSSDNDVVLQDLTVSRHHCIVYQEGDTVLIRDQGSTSGTRVNGDRLDSSPRALKDGDRITVGKAELRIFSPAVHAATATMVGTANVATPADTQILTTSELEIPASVPSAPSDSGSRVATLYIRRGPGAPRVVRWVTTSPFSIGRAPESSLVVPDDSVSRHHTELREYNGKLILVDVGSANGVVVNGRRVTHTTDLQSGDVIVAGPLELVCDPPQEVSAVLVQQGGRQDGEQYRVRNEMLIGSARDCDICLADPTLPPQLASIQVVGSDFWLKPLGDVPVIVSNSEVTTPTSLRSGDVIQAGHVKLTFRVAEAMPAQPQAVASKAKLLRQILPFAQLDDATFNAFVHAGEEVAFDAGAEIMAPATDKKKTKDVFVCVLLSGNADVIAPIAGDWGNTTVVTSLSAGDYCGERALSHKQPYPYRVEATSAVQAFRLRRAAYEKLTKEMPAVAGFFKDKVARHGLLKYLRVMPLLENIPEGALDELANTMRLQSFPAGDVLVRTNEVAHTAFVVASGSFRVDLPQGGILSTLTYLTEGKYVGEQIAGESEVSPYTVVADTAGEAYTITREEYLALIEAYPPGENSETIAVPPSVVLARTPPFDSLAPELIADAAHALRVKYFLAGDTIIYQDDPVGSAFYVIARGQVDVVFQTKEGEERSVNKLKAGQCFGEGALMTNSPRNATVRAIEDCQLLALYRREFNALLSKSPMKLGPFLGHTFNSRFRPNHIDNVEIFEQHDPNGVSYILRNSDRDTYVSLSEQGLFIWNLLDGDHTMNDIAAAYYQEYKSLAMGAMFSIIQQLQQLGFLNVSLEELMQSMRAKMHPTPLQRAMMVAGKLMTYKKEFKHADSIFRAIYFSFGRIFFTKPVLILMILINIAGIAQFTRMLVTGDQLGSIKFSGWGIVFILAFDFFVVATHEMGHGVAMVHIGRKVLGAGFGINYISPMAFVNTTDAWMATQRQRIAVTVGGLLVSLTETAIASIALAFVHQPLGRLALAEFAFLGYIGLLYNICPILPTDGYNLVMDILQIPNLRPRAFHFIFSGGIFRTKRPWGRDEKAFLVFGLIVLVFMLILAFNLAFSVILLVGPFLRHHIPLAAAVAVEILMIVMVLSSFILSMMKEAKIGASSAGA